LKCVVLYGGDTVEYKLSLESANHVESLLKTEGWHVQPVCCTPQSGQRHPSHVYLPDTVSIRNKADQIASLQGDVLMNLVTGPLSLHRQNEAVLGLLDVPVVGNPLEVQQITRNKYEMKCLMMKLEIKTPAFAFLRSEPELSAFLDSFPFSLPHILKPIDGGSSHDVVLIDNREAWALEAKRQMKLYGSVLVEEFVRGRDMSAGTTVADSVNPIALPLMEIRHHNRFFNAQVKSVFDCTFIPMEKQLPAVSVEAKKAVTVMHQRLNCRFYSRMDFIWTGETLYALECNGSPGLSRNSLIPSMYKAAGLSMAKSLSDMLSGAATV
jgi:D-alanine-D-alanine ligase